MFSLIRDVLMPAAPAVLLIGALVLAPSAGAQESHGDEKMAADTAVPLATETIPGVDIVPAEERLEAGQADDEAADARDTPQCRRLQRIGKFSVRRCQ